VDKRGYILTNNHVVEQATKIQVQLNGETTRYAAKVIGVDEDTDLAVIKIDANKELPTAKLGNSDACRSATGCSRLEARLVCRRQ